MAREYLGNFKVGQDIFTTFDSNDSDGAAVNPTSILGTNLKLIKDADYTSPESLAASELILNINGYTGIHGVSISAITHACFLTAGHDYAIIMSDGTVDSQRVRASLGEFSIENRSISTKDLLEATIQSIKIDGTSVDMEFWKAVSGIWSALSGRMKQLPGS